MTHALVLCANLIDHEDAHGINAQEDSRTTRRRFSFLDLAIVKDNLRSKE